MEGIPIRFSLTNATSEYNYTAHIKATALLSEDKCAFKVQMFADTGRSGSLPPMEVTVRYVAESTIPHWIDVRYQQPTNLSREIGKAIEQTAAGKEYIARCLLNILD